MAGSDVFKVIVTILLVVGTLVGLTGTNMVADLLAI